MTRRHTFRRPLDAFGFAMLALIAATIAFALAACTPAQKDAAVIASGSAANVAVAAMPPEDIAKMRANCAAVSSVLGVAAAPGMPAQLRETAVYPQAFCTALNAGQVPPTADANSASWWTGIVAKLPDIARAAGVILPLLL